MNDNDIDRYMAAERLKRRVGFITRGAAVEIRGMSWSQKLAVIFGDWREWRSVDHAGVNGITMAALQRRGLAEVNSSGSRKRYRLTDRGEQERARWEFEEYERIHATGFMPESRQPLALEAARLYGEVCS